MATDKRSRRRFPPSSFDETGWFVALPDCEPADLVARWLHAKATTRVTHPSGRPWLLGCWPADAASVGRCRETVLAVLGQHEVTPEQLTGMAATLRTGADLHRLAGSLAGSFHTLASMDGVMHLQGTISSHRRVFHARIGTVTVAADRADVLADLLQAELDEQQLAVCLLDPPALHPLTGKSVWRGVSDVPSGHSLQVERDGRHQVLRWWRPPNPVVPMAEGAPAFRDALSAAVGVRVRRNTLVTADLGGVDSTSVCCLASRHAGPIVAYTITNDDPGDDELEWARRTVAGLGDLEHHIIPSSELPITYDGLLGLDVPADEPCIATVDLARFQVIPRLAAARGSRLHLTGFGGDELLSGSPAHLCSMVRTEPRTALRLLRGFAAKERWPHKQVLRQLADHRPYGSWLATVAAGITAPAVTQTSSLGWGTPPRLPAWVTPDAGDGLRQLIQTEVVDAEPLAEQRGLHVELQLIQAVSRIVGQLARVAERLGVSLAAPFHDDRVIEAGLAVRPQERVTPWQYKPLLAEAMRGVVPKESLTRHTKSDGSCHEDVGLRKNRADLLALCEGCRLAQLGLIDETKFREACSRPAPLPEQIGLLYQTLACEVWLRNLERLPVPTAREW